LNVKKETKETKVYEDCQEGQLLLLQQNQKEQQWDPSVNLEKKVNEETGVLRVLKENQDLWETPDCRAC